MKYLVTGGAGYVGSNVVDRLLELGHQVVVFDNLSTGNMNFLENSMKKITFFKGDLMNQEEIDAALKGVDFVYHFAANADVKNNVNEPTKCLEQNTIATSNLLEAMRKNNVKKIAFSSTGSVYGEPTLHPTPENYSFPIQTSMYGASKLACEGLLQAYSTGYGLQVFIFRFVSLMGERYTHGCVFDFYKQLLKDPTHLHMLGNGRQRKSYLYVQDCIDAMFLAEKKSKELINIFNLGTEEYIQVTPIAEIICEELGLKNVKFTYSGGERGWIGDSPFILLDVKKMKSLGWKPTLTINQAVRKTINWLKDNQWALKERK